ncbi:MAG: hypothetical protein VKL39_21735 [Leptolyngbyaceae bacterium]|nr:hypothetical protein [Leptolyngbyaceae bacterium]
MIKLVENQCVFNLDWLQLGGKLRKVQFLDVQSPYVAKTRDIATPLFKSIVDLYDNENNHIAVIMTDPRSPIIPPDTVLVKFINRILYSSRLPSIVKQVEQVYQFDFKHITRVDLAIDFNRFIDYPDPHDFISAYVSDRIMKLGKGKFMTVGTVTKPHQFDYIRYGSPKSNLQYYLYNKSKELKQVADKPYIREFWELNQIDTLAPVWRLEFSIKTPRYMVNEVDTDTGELLEDEFVDFNKILDRKYQRNLLVYLLSKYWQFVIPRPVKRMDRLPRIKFLQLSDDYKFFRKVKPAKDVTKTDKIFIKKLFLAKNDQALMSKLEDMNAHLRGNDTIANSTIEDLINTFVHERKLQEWYKHKILENESLH